MLLKPLDDPDVEAFVLHDPDETLAREYLRVDPKTDRDSIALVKNDCELLAFAHRAIAGHSVDYGSLTRRERKAVKCYVHFERLVPKLTARLRDPVLGEVVRRQYEAALGHGEGI